MKATECSSIGAATACRPPRDSGLGRFTAVSGADVRLGPRTDEVVLEGSIEKGDFEKLHTLVTEGTIGTEPHQWTVWWVLVKFWNYPACSRPANLSLHHQVLAVS